MPLCAPLVASPLVGASFWTCGGSCVSLPTGQGSFLLSPFLQLPLISHALRVSHVFWVSRAVMGLQPGSHPVAMPRESVLPGVSPQGVIRSGWHITVTTPPSVPGAAARPQAAQSLLISASIPASSPPYREWECSVATWSVGVLPSAPGAVSSRS